MEVFLPVWYLECLNLTSPASFAFCIFVTGPLFCIVRTRFFTTAYRGIWLHYMVLVRMDLIWLSDLLNNNQTAVGIRVLTDRAKCCPTQVPNTSAQRKCPMVPMVPNSGHKSRLSRTSWGPDLAGWGQNWGLMRYFWTQRTSTSHSWGVWLYNKHCHVDWDYTNMLELILGQDNG